MIYQNFKILLLQKILSGSPILYNNIKFINKRLEVEEIRNKIRNFIINKKVIIPKNQA